MAAATNLGGRIPAVKSAVSSRLVIVGVMLFLILVGAIVFGFRYRIQKQQSRTEQQQTQTVASDAAPSNRTMVEGQRPAASLVGLPVISSPPGAPNSNTASPSGVTTQPGITAANQAPQLLSQPVQPAYTLSPPPYSPVATAPPIDTQEQLRTQARARRLQREQDALDAPTGVQDQHAAATAPLDPQQAELAQLNALLHPATTPQTPPVFGPAAGSVPPVEDNRGGYKLENGQAEKRQFGQGGEGPGDDYLKTTRTAPLSRWVVQRGTVIPAALPSKLVSDLPGDLIAEVVRDVYDSPTQTYVEIPAGSRLVGEYNSSVSYGQNRVQIVWIAIYFPDGSFVDLDRMPAHSADGSTGLKDQTDNHWKRTIVGVALSSLLSAGLQVSQNRTNGSVLTYPSTGQEIASSVGTQASQLGEQLTNRNLNVQPTLKIRPGEIFAVSVKKDILFPGPYEPMIVR